MLRARIPHCACIAARCAFAKRIERLFACIKPDDGLRRLRLRGLRGAGEQFLLAVAARNLKRMAQMLAPPIPIAA